jgi:RNA polymerase sigma-70 factor, ECF subfamily
MRDAVGLETDTGSIQLAALANEADTLRPELHRYAARIMGSVIDGEDVIQDAFAKALVGIGSIAPETPIRPWLFRIVHNRAIDILRQRGAHRSEPLDNASDLTDVNTIDAEDVLIRRDTVRFALERFVELPVPQRSAVILKDVLGESLADIAAMLELSVDAVKAHLSRGRARLRSIIAAPPEVSPPPSPEALNFAALFNAQDWDALRRLLADDVRLRQSRRPEVSGAPEVGRFFTYYAEYPRVRLEPARLEGREILVVVKDEAETPSYFMLLEWRGQKISLIRDHRYATYVIEGADVIAASQVE